MEFSVFQTHYVCFQKYCIRETLDQNSQSVHQEHDCKNMSLNLTLNLFQYSAYWIIKIDVPYSSVDPNELYLCSFIKLLKDLTSIFILELIKMHNYWIFEIFFVFKILLADFFFVSGLLLSEEVFWKTSRLAFRGLRKKIRGVVNSGWRKN